MWESFAVQRILTFFQQKWQCICNINVWNFNETLTNDVVSFEQLAPVLYRAQPITSRSGVRCSTIKQITLPREFKQWVQLIVKSNVLYIKCQQVPT